MIAVLKHELSNYFHSMTAYIFGAFLMAFVVIISVLTMRVIAEERKQKTDQLLYSLPITTTQVVIGKYLALLIIYLIPLCVVAVYPLIFVQYGEVYVSGVFDMTAIIYYLSVIVFFLFLSVQSLEKRRYN
ncbi:MAG: ABC transporter permease [Lachnospiraceae bacterium]|nr:ABC transporter permease [Lachnospiraceae bacterium]